MRCLKAAKSNAVVTVSGLHHASGLVFRLGGSLTELCGSLQQNYNSGFYYQLNLTSFPSAFSQATKDALIYDTITDGNGFKVNSNYVSPASLTTLFPGPTPLAGCQQMRPTVMPRLWGSVLCCRSPCLRRHPPPTPGSCTFSQKVDVKLHLHLTHARVVEQVTNHRARSIHIKANNGVIANNVVENPNIYGMLLTPDLYFLEGDFQHNVTISNNYVSAPCVACHPLTAAPRSGVPSECCPG